MRKMAGGWAAEKQDRDRLAHAYRLSAMSCRAKGSHLFSAYLCPCHRKELPSFHFLLMGAPWDGCHCHYIWGENLVSQSPRCGRQCSRDLNQADLPVLISPRKEPMGTLEMQDMEGTFDGWRPIRSGRNKMQRRLTETSLSWKPLTQYGQGARKWGWAGRGQGDEEDVLCQPLYSARFPHKETRRNWKHVGIQMWWSQSRTPWKGILPIPLVLKITDTWGWKQSGCWAAPELCLQSGLNKRRREHHVHLILPETGTQ